MKNRQNLVFMRLHKAIFKITGHALRIFEEIVSVQERLIWMQDLEFGSRATLLVDVEA